MELNYISKIDNIQQKFTICKNITKILTKCKVEYYNLVKKNVKENEMISSNVIDLRILVENYIEINDFNDLLIETKINPAVLTALVGCIEGIITPSEDKSYFTFFEVNKKDNLCEFLFQDIYKFIKDNKIVYNHIVNYFNMWHGKEIDMFTYDDYHIQDIINNIFKLKLYLDEEYEMAKKNENKYTIILYEQSLRLLSMLLC